MELNQNSISARLYRWFYITDQLPTNLCPYFWKLVLAYIFFLPLLVFTGPSRLFDKSTTDTGNMVIGSMFMYTIAFIGLAIMFTIVSWIGWGVIEGPGFWKEFQKIGAVSGLLMLLMAIVFGIVYLFDLRKQKLQRKRSRYIYTEEGDYVPNPDYVEEEPNPNIIVEFIKAKYNRYCPTIKWK